MDTRAVAFAELPPVAPPHRRLKVGVLVDLPRGPKSGGHVRCWERLAEAALNYPHALDLTVHFMGVESGRCDLGDNVRYVTETPAFSTERLRFLSHVPDHTDLAPFHPRLARMLPDYDVIHTTDAYFAYARTAMKVGRRKGIPIVNSVHTNTPEYARIFTVDTIERSLGNGIAARILLGRFRVPHRIEARMSAQLAAYQRRCAFALVSRPGELEALRLALGGRASLLRRGIDHLQFNPAKRDRAWLAAAFGISPERVVVMYAGRLNRGKNILLLVDAIEHLLARGVDVHLLCAGEGDLHMAIERRLGSRVTCPGAIDSPDQLARLYACADLFAFPSCIEESANVVLESLASGLPLLVAREGSMGRMVDRATGMILSGNESGPWIEAIAALARDPARRRDMGRAARRYAERMVPSWATVLAEDLLPYWERAAHEAASAR